MFLYKSYEKFYTNQRTENIKIHDDNSIFLPMARSNPSEMTGFFIAYPPIIPPKLPESSPNPLWASILACRIFPKSGGIALVYRS